MPEFCTCGAELPPDARFCHKCAKPQREEDIPKAEIATDEVDRRAPPVAPQPVALNFRNRAALRVGLLSAFLAFVLSSLLPFLMVIWSTVGGFFAVYLYRRRTGQTVSVLGGARMGWMTGVIMFLIMASLLALTLTLLASIPGGVNGLAAQMKNMPVQKEKVDQLVQMIQELQKPLSCLTALATTFLVISVATTTGGAIGGKLVGRG